MTNTSLLQFKNARQEAFQLNLKRGHNMVKWTVIENKFRGIFGEPSLTAGHHLPKPALWGSPTLWGPLTRTIFGHFGAKMIDST